MPSTVFVLFTLNLMPFVVEIISENSFDFWYDSGKTFQLLNPLNHLILLVFWVRGTTRFEIYAHYTSHLSEWIYRERCVGLYV